jgi:hypothetical protein
MKIAVLVACYEALRNQSKHRDEIRDMIVADPNLW